MRGPNDNSTDQTTYYRRPVPCEVSLCPRNTPRTRPAIAASSSGYGRASWKASCAYWPMSCTPEDNWNWRRLSSTPPSRGQERGLRRGATKRGKGRKIIAVADDHSLPLAVSIESTAPHESQLVDGVLGNSFLTTLPARLIGDKAYDVDRLDRDLADRHGIEMIAPHHGPRREPTQDGRSLRRYRRRWRVELDCISFVGCTSAGSTKGVCRLPAGGQVKEHGSRTFPTSSGPVARSSVPDIRRLSRTRCARSGQTTEGARVVKSMGLMICHSLKNISTRFACNPGAPCRGSCRHGKRTLPASVMRSRRSGTNRPSEGIVNPKRRTPDG